MNGCNSNPAGLGGGITTTKKKRKSKRSSWIQLPRYKHLIIRYKHTSIQIYFRRDRLQTNVRTALETGTTWWRSQRLEAKSPEAHQSADWRVNSDSIVLHELKANSLSSVQVHRFIGQISSGITVNWSPIGLHRIGHVIVSLTNYSTSPFY